MDPDETLEDLLHDKGPGQRDDALFVRTLDATLGVVARRRRVRTGLRAVSMIGAFVVGMIVHEYWPSPADDPVPERDATEAVVSTFGDDAHGIELAAEVSEGEARARLYRMAGDAWLREQGDPMAATRCYRRHLEILGPASVAGLEDTWLLLALRRTLND